MKKDLKLRKLLIVVPLLLAIVMAIFLRNPQDVHPDPAVLGTSHEGAAIETSVESVVETEQSFVMDEKGEYTSKEDVAEYIHAFGKLPSNFITKKEAQKLGWTGGSLEKYAPGKSIGGDYFGNYEGLLPSKKGRKYYECDIDTKGKSKRGAKRIIYSNDGLIYYTEDHYESFELLYGEP